MIKPLAAVFAGLVIASLTSAPARAADAPPAAPQPTPQQQIVAEVGPAKVTSDQLIRTLIDGYGLNVLLNLVQLEIAKQNTAKANIIVTPADIAAERDLTIENMFKDSNEKQLDRLNTLLGENKTAEAAKLRDEIKHDNDQALGQFLANQHISEAEFNIVIETNANLRKLAAPQLKGKISDENLKDAFNALYGETVRCRHIQCNRPLAHPGSETAFGERRAVCESRDGDEREPVHRAAGRQAADLQPAVAGRSAGVS